MMNPVRTWKSSVSLLTLLYAYSFGIYFLYVIPNSVKVNLSNMLWVLSGLCCAVAFVEVVVSHVRHRKVNGILAGTALTVCAILTVTVGVTIIPYLFHSLSAAFSGSVSLAISLGPPCCLAAATWVGRRTLENYHVRTDNEFPGEET